MKWRFDPDRRGGVQLVYLHKPDGYNAFISYNHIADGTLAAALQSALRTFAKPWYKLRALHIFRDQTNLAVNPALWSSIRAALDQSSFFILLLPKRRPRPGLRRRPNIGSARMVRRTS